MKSFFLLLLLIAACWGQYPSSGVYLSLSSNALASSMETISNNIMNAVNAYTGWPAESGSSSSASYTFQNWKVATLMVDPQWKVVGYDELGIGWKNFNFTIEANYHVCATAWPNPCEDGNLYIYSADNSVSLFLDTIIDADQSPVFVNVTQTVLNFDQNGVEVYVQCTNTFCLIPVDDIAQAVAEDFYDLFTDGISKEADKAISEHMESFKTLFQFSDGLGLDMRSDWWMLPGNTGYENGIIFVPSTGGFYTDVSGSTSYPPFNASFTPSISYLQNPPNDFNLAVCEYFFSSLLWGLNDLGIFDKTITSSEVPADSPVQLNTNDAFFQQVVPGLTAYPNMDITITSKLIYLAVPTIDSEGIHIDGTNITLDFALSNSTYSKHGWTLSNVFNVGLMVNASVSNNVIMFNASMTGFNSTVDVMESDVGNITAAGFSTLYQLLQSQIKLPGFAMTVPANFAVTNPAITFYSSYFAFNADFTYSEVEIDEIDKIDENEAALFAFASDKKILIN